MYTNMEISNRYFSWLCHLIDADECFHFRYYEKLLTYMDSVEFTYIIPMDANRAGDGVNLRYHYKYRQKLEDVAFDIFDNKPCSVLEALVGLAVRCESQIMAEPEYGDRTPKWFWDMIENLGLIDMDDDNFDYEYVVYIIQRFLNREYEPDGTGGLFTIPDCEHDLRDVEIWYQLNWYLSDIQ